MTRRSTPIPSPEQQGIKSVFFGVKISRAVMKNSSIVQTCIVFNEIFTPSTNTGRIQRIQADLINLAWADGTIVRYWHIWREADA